MSVVLEAAGTGRAMAEVPKRGVIMDLVTAEQAKGAEDAGPSR